MDNQTTTVTSDQPENTMEVSQTETAQPEQPLIEPPNQLTFLPVFPTVITRVKLELPVDQMHKELVGMASDIVNYEGGFTTYFNSHNISNVYGMGELRVAIFGVCQAIGKQMNYDLEYEKCSIQMWTSVMRHKGIHPPHFHPRAVFSGTFYPKWEKGMSPIGFVNPTHQMRMHEPIVKDGMYNDTTSPSYTVEPADNILLVWPSWLYHYVPMMTEHSGPRVSVSFNVDYLPKGA